MADPIPREQRYWAAMQRGLDAVLRLADSEQAEMQLLLRRRTKALDRVVEENERLRALVKDITDPTGVWVWDETPTAVEGSGAPPTEE